VFGGSAERVIFLEVDEDVFKHQHQEFCAGRTVQFRRNDLALRFYNNSEPLAIGRDALTRLTYGGF
jgi:hypothetical protein